MKSTPFSPGYAAGILTFILLIFPSSDLLAQTETNISLDPTTTRQSVTGFGAALAYYEGWLNAHPNKSEIYEIIFGELSLDILRVRNAYDYDPDMVGRVKEYMNAAETSLGFPIQLLSTSWGPPGSLKNTGDRKNGGSLRYTAGPEGVEFDYSGFASWWKASLAEYEANGIMPDYISIQNEPGFSATWESCIFKPRESITATDTIAGYDKALDAVYDTLSTIQKRPKILGPETVGIGYNNVQNYVNALDLSKLDGMAHHLYHGVDENDPWASDKFTELGNFHPEMPHFQTEYSRGDWFSIAGLMYKSFHDEEVVSYMYWDLIWGDQGGLVTVEFPWDSDRWTDPTKGYVVNREYYAFRQFSAFVHPGWKRINTQTEHENLKVLTFVSPGMDSISCVVINRSETGTYNLHIDVDGYRIAESSIFRTSETEECILVGELTDSTLLVNPYSITTVAMEIEVYDPGEDTEAPSTPINVSIVKVDETSITIDWDASNDNIGVSGYNVFLDDVLHGSSSVLSYEVQELTPNTTYEFLVSAFDDAGNESGKSDPISGTTLYFDREAPVVEVTDSIYQEGLAEILSSEAGMVYLVPEGTEKVLPGIRNAALDSTEVEAEKVAEIPITGLENGTYWFYACDSAENISEPAVLILLGVGRESQHVSAFKLYPNPFTEQSTIYFTLDMEQEMWLTLMDSQGRVFRKETLGVLPSGKQSLVIQRRDLPGGIYFFRLENSGSEGPAGSIIIQD